MSAPRNICAAAGVDSIADALERYGKPRLARDAADVGIGIQSVLEIVASFCDEVGPDLCDPFSQRRLAADAARGDAPAPRDLLAPGWLIHLLTPCARLFPYQIVAGSGVIAAFREEAPRLARWLRRRGLSAPAQDALFTAAWARAAPDIARQLRLQRALERSLARIPRLLQRGEVVAGRFLVERADQRGMWVTADAGVRGPVRAAAPVLALFEAGTEVSLAFQRAVIGWTLLAASLPCRPGELDRLLDEARATEARR